MSALRRHLAHFHDLAHIPLWFRLPPQSPRCARWHTKRLPQNLPANRRARTTTWLPTSFSAVSRFFTPENATSQSWAASMCVASFALFASRGPSIVGARSEREGLQDSKKKGRPRTGRYGEPSLQALALRREFGHIGPNDATYTRYPSTSSTSTAGCRCHMLQHGRARESI